MHVPAMPPPLSLDQMCVKKKDKTNYSLRCRLGEIIVARRGNLYTMSALVRVWVGECETV